MQKILELTTKEWISGCDLQSNLDNDALFIQSGTIGVSGVTPLLRDSESSGALGVSVYPSFVGDYTSPDEVIMAAVSDKSNADTYSDGVTYAYDTAGNIYERPFTNNSGSQNADLIRSTSPLNDAACGLDIFTKLDGTRYLLYAREGGIGRTQFPVGDNTYEDDWSNSGYQNTSNHPMHSFQGRTYFGNDHFVGYVGEQSGSMTVVQEALDLPKTKHITNLDDDGKYLIIATQDGSIYFWDPNTNADSWQRSYEIKGVGELYHVETVRGITYCLGSELLAVVSYSSPPEITRRFLNINGVTNTASFNSVSYSKMGPVKQSEFNNGDLYTQNIAMRVGEGIIWGNGQECLSYFGKLTPDVDEALHSFSHNMGEYNEGSTQMFMLSNNNYAMDVFSYSFDFDDDTSPAENYQWYSINNSDDYKNTLEPSSFASRSDFTNFADNISAITRPIYLEDRYQISEIKVVFARNLATESLTSLAFDPPLDEIYYDKISIDVSTNDDSRYADSQVVSTETVTWDRENGDTSEIKRFDNPLTGEVVQLKINFLERDPTIKSIILYGEQIADNT